jgi:Ni2+-binding GTPase involved in maturation of urease and hydrogenase
VKLHIIAGFLGSGKTTAILGAARHLMAQGQRVGVVTNDQGKYLVDTAFFRMADVPAVEVTNGCFCCHYDDLEERLSQLQAGAQPDVIFAESVGSCADIVATVVRPLLELRQAADRETTYSTFADARLLLRRLRGQPLPFSEDVIYIFDQQIAEAALLVINKIDLLNDADLVDVLTLARAAYPDKALLPQDSRDQDYIAQWLARLAVTPAQAPEVSLVMDYDRYGAGEARLAWLDERLELSVPSGQGRAVALRLLEGLNAAIRGAGWAIGHAKFVIEAGGAQAKISFPTLEEPGWQAEVPELPGEAFSLLVNARVEAEAEALSALVRQAAARALAGTGAVLRVASEEAFHPGYPTPTHRMG